MSPHEVSIVVLVVAALALSLPILACEARLRRMYGERAPHRDPESWDGEVR